MVNVEATPEQLEMSHPERDVTVTQTIQQPPDVNPTRSTAQGSSSGPATAASLLRDTVPKLFSSFKSQNQVPAFVVILLAFVIVLMQVDN